MARNYLESYLGELVYDLLLILILTMVLFSATPTILSGKHEFEIGLIKDISSFVANLTTCILWFLRSDHFTTADSNGTILSIIEIIKKIEHKGINNRFLYKLG